MLHILAFFAAMCAGCCLLKRRFEQVLPLALLSAMPVLTVLAVLQRLSWVDGLAVVVLAVAAGLAVWAVAAKGVSLRALVRGLAKNVFTPGLFCFVLLAGFFAYATEPMAVWWRDDASHWALAVKSLYFFDGLVEGPRHLGPLFATYTPGLQVLQWLAMHIRGGWRESMLYFPLFMTYTVFLLPLCARLRWRHAWLVPAALLGLVAFPVWGNVVSYTFLGVDTALALCLGYTLMQLWRARNGDGFALFSAALGLCGLVLIKQAGMVLALMAMAMLPLVRRCGKKELLCVLSPLVVWGAWMLFCGVQGLGGMHTTGMSDRLAEWLRGEYVLPEGAEGLLEALWLALTAPLSGSLIYDTAPLLNVPKILVLAAVSIAPWPLARVYGDKRLKRVAVLFSAITLVYLLLQWLSFYTVFYYETSVYVLDFKQNMILLMERYLAPLQLGMGMFALWLLVETAPGRLMPHGKRLPYGMAVLALALGVTVNWAVLYENLSPGRYYQQSRAAGIKTEILMDHDWAAVLAGRDDACVLLGYDPTAEYIRSFRYTFAPCRFESPEVGSAESPEALGEFLLEKGITHLICFEDGDSLYQSASALTQEGDLYTWTLYEVIPGDEGVELVEYYE